MLFTSVHLIYDSSLPPLCLLEFVYIPSIELGCSYHKTFCCLLKITTMASSSKSINVHHTRSVSLPSRSHPSTLQIEEQLSKLKRWEASSTCTVENIHDGLTGLEKLYTCVGDLLNSGLTQQALSRHQNEKWVNELLDQSVRLLDTCGSTKDVMSQVKENVRDLQSALRRRTGDSSTERSIAQYNSSRRRTKKDAKLLIVALKQIDVQVGSSPLLDLDHHLLSVIRVLRDVIAVTISLLLSLLLFFCSSVSKPKPTRWSVVSKLIHKGATKTEDLAQISDESASIESHVEGTENGLESVFRSLIKTRASLLNILSH